jgi:hypothetical protein
MRFLLRSAQKASKAISNIAAEHAVPMAMPRFILGKDDCEVSGVSETEFDCLDCEGGVGAIFESGFVFRFPCS